MYLKIITLLTFYLWEYQAFQNYIVVLYNIVHTRESDKKYILPWYFKKL